uniref:Uncharacterized protein n=1 Tax=Knipowitschia caucasica TaxID=637954 RepID=A0AAV2KKE1_KNICA
MHPMVVAVPLLNVRESHVAAATGVGDPITTAARDPTFRADPAASPAASPAAAQDVFKHKCNRKTLRRTRSTRVAPISQSTGPSLILLQVVGLLWG